PGRVTVGDRAFEASKGVVIGTGTQPAIPPIEGLQGTPLWTNREAIEADTLPESLLVLGGGAIGIELAQRFAPFGVAVTMVEALDRLIAVEEPASSRLAQEALERDGITVRCAVKATRVDYTDNAFSVALEDGTAVQAQKLLVATGRTVDLARLVVE